MTSETQQQAFVFPLSFAQQRLWFLDQYEGGSATYNISHALRAEGRIDVPALERALNAVVARHETLRTTFRTMDRQPVQVIHPEVRIPIPVEDMTSVPMEGRLRRAADLVTRESRLPFDLSTGPLLRLKLFRLAGDNHILHINIHHIVADGWSMHVLVRELIAAYQADLEGRTLDLPELAIQYVDFAQWQRDWLQGEALSTRLAYWKEKLSGVPRKLDLPTDRSRPPFMTFQGKAKTYSVDRDLRERLEDISHASRATLYMTMLAAFAALISYYTREEDVVIASPIANRNRPEIEPLIGFFVNTLPLRVRLQGNPTFTELLKQVEQTCHEAYQNQDLPFEKLVNDLGLVRDLSRAPLAQIAFAHQNVRMPDLEMAGLRFTDFEVQTGTAKTDLVVLLEEEPRGMLARVEYNTDLFDEATIDEILAGYQRLLKTLADDPARPLNDLYRGAQLRDLTPAETSAEDTVISGYLQKSNLTENQLHLWLGQKLIGDNPLYNLKTVYTLHEPVDYQHFQNAFQKIVDLNENFRTVFVEEGGFPGQRVLDELRYEVPYLDFSDVTDPAAAARDWIESQSGRVFDLSRPSFESVLIKIAEDKYQWYMNQHHILTDGWSLHLTYNQLTEFYRASLEGRLDRVEAKPQFGKYIEDEQAFRRSERHRRARSYWEGLMCERPEAPDFYGITPPRKATAIQRISRPQQGTLIRRINALREHPQLAGLAEHTLKYNFFLALYALFISRISGRRTVSIGVPVHNRRTREHVDIQGLFMHILPLFIDINENESLIDLMQQIKRKTFNAMKHGQYVVRNSPRDPAYDVLFNYQMWRLPNFYKKAFELEWLHSGHTFESCGLQVHDFEKEVRGEERLTFDFEFKLEIFDEPLREQAMTHFFRLLESSLDDISRPMRGLEMVSQDERRGRLTDLNDTVTEYPKDMCVHQLIEQQALRTPDKTAVVCGDRRMTYRELDARANQLARHLTQAGIRPGQAVGICCRPGTDMITGLLGILKSGAAYIPIDPTYPADRLRTMFEAAPLAALIVHDASVELHNFAELKGDAGFRVINLDAQREELDAQSATAPQSTVSSGDLVYMIFTSGSTGTPKAAGVYHAGFTNLLWWFTRTLDLTAADNVLVISSLSFDLTQKNLYAPLLVGGTLNFNPDCYYDPKHIADIVVEQGITWLNCTPSAFYPILDRARTDRYQPLQGLRYVVLGGEPIALPRLRPWLESSTFTGRVMNSYGPTECTDVTTYHILSEATIAADQSVPIGRPVANTQHYVLDEYLRPVPAGVPGELCIAGDCVGAGYIFDAEMSAVKFIDNPFGNGKLYRTGDIVRLRSDSEIEFVGRSDDQVKIRGFRIELGDITAALNRHPAVKESVVIAADDGRGNKSLAAYVVGNNGPICPASLRNDLKNELPEYMVPHSVTQIESMPLSPNGKLDRRALPSPAETVTEEETAYEAPRNELEQSLAAIWSEVTGAVRVGIHDNFFDLGGHSLMATQIVSLIRDAVGAEIPVRALFEAPTVAGLSAVVTDALSAGVRVDARPIPRVSREERIALSYGQEHIWVMENMTDAKATFNMPVALRVAGPVDTDRLQHVLDEIIDRHEVLRTIIKTDGMEFFQCIQSPAGLPLEIIDVDALPEAKQEEYGRRFIMEEARRPFDLTTGPIIRAYLLRFGSADHILVINVHHIAFDAFSANIILREIGILYRDLAPARPSPLPQLAVQYADYAAWQRGELSGPEYRDKLRVWQDRLKGADASLPLPTDNPRPAVQTYAGADRRFTLDAETVAVLERLARDSSSTLYMTLLAAFATVISQWCGEEDIVLASPVAGRTHKDTAGMIGLFVNLLPQRIDLSGNPTFTELLERVRTMCLESQEYQDVTFDHIIGSLDIPHDPGRSPFSQVVFNLQHAPEDRFSVDNLEFSPVEYERDTANTDIAVMMDQEAGGAVRGMIEFNTDLFRPETIDNLLRNFIAVVREAAVQPGRQLSAIYEACGLDATMAHRSQKEKDPFGYYLQHSNLSGHQLILWAGQQLDRENPIYNSTITYRMPEPIDIDHFRKAFQAVIDTRDSLRTVIRKVDGIPQRHVVDHLEYHVIHQDFSREDDPEAAVQAWISRQAKTAFPLDQCLFRCALLKVAENDCLWFMSQHHIITDGWSQVLVYKSTSEFYKQSLQDELSLPALPQFEDYVDLERSYRGSEREKKDATYWEALLAEKDDALTYYGRSPVKQGTAMTRLSRRLGEELSAGIMRWVEGQETERNTAESIKFQIFLTVFAVFLWRISGKRVFNIGIPLHNRRGKDTKDVTGLVMRVVPLRVDIDPQATFRELMATIRRSLLKAMQHGQYLINNNHKDPVYDVLLNFHTWKGEPFYAKALTVDWKHPMQAFESLALNVHDMERDMGGRAANLQIDFDFHREVFPPELQQQTMNHFCHLLSQCIGNLDHPVQKISLLMPDEERQILRDWNDTAMPLPETCIHRVIEEQAARAPEAIALRYEDRSMSYVQLNAEANRLAHYLRANGVRRDVLVGICMERSLEMVIGLLAIVKAGGAYVPVDPTYPRDRIAFMLEDSGVSLLLTQQRLAGQLPEHAARVVCVDTDQEHWAVQAATNPQIDIAPADLAYMIYTSGSTGKPKGAMNTHVAILNRLLWMQREYQLTAEDRILQKTPFSFDVSVWEFFWPLMAGATLVVARPEGHKDSAYLRDLIIKEGVTTLHFVPSMLQIFLEEEGIERISSLKRVICSGEALSVEVQNRFFARLSAGLHNLYGPTEAAVDVTYWACRPDDDRHTVPIGRPVANTQIYILDPDMRPVPVGVAGELHIGGIQLARGYHNREELTREKFIPDPFSDDPQDRLYKTGDLATFMSDGNIEFLGRIDHQVKIRGFRIELGEIETALLRHPHIKECVVVAHKDAGGNDSLVAYLVADGGEPKLDEVRAFLLESLPDYMVPAVMMVIESMPLSPNGKLDRRALPEPQASRSGLSSEYASPRTPLEEQLVEIFKELLGLDRVGIHDNFFQLGGHSLQAIRLISRIRADLSVDLPLRLFFESSHVADLAVQIEAARELATRRPPLELSAVPRGQRMPLAFTQQRLWILDQLEPGSSAYNMPTAIGIKGPFRVQLFERIFNTIIQRHEVLRTAFAEENGQPYLVIEPELSISLPVEDLTHVPAEKLKEEAWRIATREAATPFDLTRGPLVRARVLRLEKDEHVLMFTTHHIITDGWSIAVFVEEIQQMYTAFSSNLPPVLPDLPIQFADYAYWQNEWFKGEALKPQIEYWKNKMKGAPALLELPTDRVRPPIEGYAGTNIDFMLDADLTARLKKLAQESGVTLFMLLHAAFLLLLARYSRQEDIVLGTPTANRNFHEVEPLIGFFVNTLLLRVDLSGDPTFEQLLKRVRQTDIEAFEQQQVPFEHLLETLRPERSLSYSPWFQVLFVLQNTPGWDSRQIKDLEFYDFGYETTSAKFDLCLDMREDENRLTGLFQYKTELFDAATINGMICQFRRLLQGIVQGTDKRISEYSLIEQTDADKILLEWNRTDKEYPHDQCIHQLFEEQVKKRPQALALVQEDRQLTYEQLNRRANVLAHYLRNKGVRPGKFVGVCIERCPEMIVSLLAILKAGGAYVPLDPNYPTDRLQFMIDDTGLAVVLTSQRVFDERSLLFSDAVEAVCLDSHWETIEQEFDGRGHQPPNGYPLNSGNLAYIIYTSGSTGTPKGVMIEHRSLVNYACWARHAFGITPEDRFLQFASISFDAAGEEIYTALTSGAALVLRTDEMISSGRTFFELCGRWGITALETPTAYWHQLVTDLMNEPDIEIPGCLKVFVIGGERALPEKVRNWARRVGARPRLINGYGPTETTIACTAKYLSPAESESQALREVPIGNPVANTQAFILDEHRQPLPVGVPGELYIGGDGLARGYLNQDALTDERFVMVAFEGGPPQRLYRTGDLCRYLPNGDIEYRGRIDDQVKIRGFRIELGEVESVLAQHPEVGECTVLVKETGDANRRLIAYVAADEKRVDGPELRAFMQERLPEYMVPSGYLLMAQLPVSGAGKINRQALLAMPVEQDGGREYIPPRDEMEQKVAAIWQDVLGLEKVGIHDNFFELGGHSLIATQLVSRVLQVFGVRMPLLELFQQPTVEGVSDYIREQQGQDAHGFTAEIIPQDRSDNIPATAGQQRLWNIEKQNPGLPTYNMPAAFRVRGSLVVDVLRRVIREMVRRHESLRTTFKEVDQTLNQVLHEEIPDVVAYMDLRDVPDVQREAEVRRLVEEEKATPFDMATGPLLRVRVFQVEPAVFYLTLVMHHSISDGWSVEIIVRELAVLYECFANNRPSILPELPIQFADYSLWQNRWQQTDDYRRKVDYWRNNLRGAPPLLTVKTDFPRPAVRSFEGAAVPMVLDSAVFEPVRRLSRELGVTLFMVLVAAFAIVLRRQFDQEDVLIGTAVARRNRREVEDLIGLFTNNICLRLDVSGSPTFAQLVQRTQKVCLDGYAHQDVPLSIITEAAGAEIRKDYHPLFQVTMVLQNASANTGWTLPQQNVEITGIPHESTKAKYDLTFGLEEAEGALHLNLNYSTDLFKATTIMEMLNGFRSVLIEAAADPHHSISDIGDRPARTEPVPVISEKPGLSVEISRSLVSMQSGSGYQGASAQAPLFLIHPGGGNVFCYMPMIPALGPGLPVYGLQSVGLEGEHPPLITVEEMAAHYVDLIRRVQPEGPYRLLGWSFGGVVAYEIARLLTAGDQQIEMLSVIDSYIPSLHKLNIFGGAGDDATVIGHLVEHLEGMFGCSLKVDRRRLNKQPNVDQLAYVRQCAVNAGMLPDSFSDGQMQNFYAVYKANHMAAQAYQPQALPLPVNLFCPRKQNFVLVRANVHAWKKLTGDRVKVFDVGGDHYSVMQSENLTAVVKELRRQMGGRT